MDCSLPEVRNRIMVTETNYDYYCPKCGLQDTNKQTVTEISQQVLTDKELVPIQQFNCGICKLKSFIGVPNEIR